MAVRGVGLRTIISNCSYIFLFLPNDKIVLKSTGCIQSSLVLFLNSPCVTNINIFCSQYHYNIVKWTGIKWEQGQITACKGHFFNTKLWKLNEKCMVNRRIFIWKSCEWIKGSPNISTKLTIYYVCRLTEFEDICASGCCSREFPLNFDWMSWEGKERRKRNVERSAWERQASSVLSRRTSLCLFPNTWCHFVRQKTKTRSELQNINIYEKPERFDLVGLGFAGFDKHFYRECPRSKPLLHVFKKTFLRFAARRQQADVLYANGGIGFCKYETRKNLWTTTFALPSLPGWKMAARAKY